MSAIERLEVEHRSPAPVSDFPGVLGRILPGYGGCRSSLKPTCRASRGADLHMRVTRFDARAKLRQTNASDVAKRIIENLDRCNPALARKVSDASVRKWSIGRRDEFPTRLATGAVRSAVACADANP